MKRITLSGAFRQSGNSTCQCGVIFTLLLLLCMVHSALRAQVAFPKILDITSHVNSDTLNSFVRILSGEDPVTINSETWYITSRVPGMPTHTVARSYILSKLSGYGLETHEQYFSTTYTGYNAYAVQPGKIPDQIYIICAHYDAVTSYAADDNATGVAAVLEAARLLSRYSTEYTVIYALWDQEEKGLVGSKYYAQWAKSNGMDIKKVINLDMLGWDSNNDGLAEIHTRNYAGSVQMASDLAAVNTTYQVGLNPLIKNPGSTASDHSSFWNNGYSAILLIEGYYAGDFTPHYHKVTDRFSTLNTAYLYKMARLGITGLSHYVINSYAMIAGTVYHDTDRMTDNTVDGTGTGAGGTLYANLLDDENLVVVSVPVNADGSYTFPDVETGTFTVQLTINPGVAGLPMPATLLPPDRINTGEHHGAGPGDDGAADGLLTLVVDGVSNVAEANFGIDRVPDITAVLTVVPNIMHGLTSFSVVITVTELNGVYAGGVISLAILKDSRWVLDGPFDPELTELVFTPLNNNVWSYSADEQCHIFTTTSVIPAGSSSTLGFRALWDGGQALGVYTITCQIVSGSDEIRINNNVDAEGVDYFIY